jgi:hypothetical protein
MFLCEICNAELEEGVIDTGGNDLKVKWMEESAQILELLKMAGSLDLYRYIDVTRLQACV